MGEEVERTESEQAVEVGVEGGKAQKRSKWLWGCGLGCGTVLVLTVLVIVGASLWSMAKIDQAREQAIAELGEHYPKWKAEGIYPKEHQALFDELAAAGQEEGASGAKALLCYFAVGSASEDGQVDDLDVEYALLVQDFLKDHPDCTWSEVGQLFYVNPVLQERVVALRNELAARKQGGGAQ